MVNAPNDFFKEENRSGYMVSAQMKKVWAIEIDLVQELLRVCDKYNLRCWIDSGTLLGAVRHKGFIPWDDDIDLIMFREDYDTLAYKASKEFKAPYFLQTAYTDKNYVLGHAKLRNIHTSAVSSNNIHKKFNQGIFIDIFVLDGISNDSHCVAKQEKKLRLINKVLMRSVDSKITKPKHLLYAPLLWLLWGCGERYIKLYKIFENTLRGVNIQEVDYVNKFSFYLKAEKLQDKHSYDSTITLDFEYVKLPAPIDYHNVLTVLYGNDYMTPKQLPTDHGVAIFDTERPSEELIKELKIASRKG
jgi:lipopolysaccharide cholinephosphotransferase